MERRERLGRFQYLQGAFPLGQDTLLLGAFPALRPGMKVCDLGCGAGALPLLLLGRGPPAELPGWSTPAPWRSCAPQRGGC